MARLFPLFLALVLLPELAPAQAPLLEPVDRVVALVDEEPILLSDLERVIALGLVPKHPGDGDRAVERRALDQLIELALRQNELGRFGYQQVPVDEVDRQLELIRARFGTAETFAGELARLGTDEQGVRQLLARQLATLTFVEERLGPRIFVGIDDIRKYYDEVLVPELAAKGQSAPPVETVRESIRALLREQRLDEEIERWTAELRRQADIVDLLDAGESSPPPVVDSWTEPVKP